jgi:hypothetical protein
MWWNYLKVYWISGIFSTESNHCSYKYFCVHYAVVCPYLLNLYKRSILLGKYWLSRGNCYPWNPTFPHIPFPCIEPPYSYTCCCILKSKYVLFELYSLSAVSLCLAREYKLKVIKWCFCSLFEQNWDGGNSSVW